ncbi:MAG: hypothetical protein HZC36_09780 [Armatimonadetes bacterium]|nr:hypothetical protein [Armatimonadota bacterium]
MNDLSWVFLRKPKPSGVPAYRSLAELGTALFQWEPAVGKRHGFRSARSAAAYLSLVFSGQRPCDSSLQVALRALLSQKLEGIAEPDRIVWEQEVDIAIDGRRPKLRGRKEGLKRRLAALAERSVDALITLRAGETSPRSVRSNPLTPVLMKRLGLFEQGASNHPLTWNLMVAVPSNKAAQAWLESVFNLAIGATFGNPAGDPLIPRKAALRIQEHSAQGALQVYVADSAYCVPSVVVFNRTHPPNTTGFCLAGAELMNIVEFSDEELQDSPYIRLKLPETSLVDIMAFLDELSAKGERLYGIHNI